MATRTSKTTAKKTTPPRKTTPRKTAAKKAAADTTATVIQLRPPLATRRRSAADPYTPEQLTEARAAYASAMAMLPIPVLAWIVPSQATSRRAAAHMADGTVITHVADRAPVFTADIPCRHGARHETTIRTAEALSKARQDAATCEYQHAAADQHRAITDGITPTPDQPVKVNALPEGIKRATAAAAETQPLPLTDIAEGLATRTADTETPKEHPQP